MPVQTLKSKTTLPDSLQNPQDIAKIKKSVTQWSRLVAWSWTDVLAFEGNAEKEKQEKTLKSFFIQTLQKQAQNMEAFESYGISQSQSDADKLAADFKSLLLGDNHKITFLKKQGITLTLSDVLYALSGEKYVVSTEREFTDKFTFQAVVNEFTGSIHQIKDEAGNFKDEYVALMAYPQKPLLSEATVTEEQLTDWAKNLNTGGRYLPPSVYIPIAGSS
ncbi:hypothetical protein [Spirulina sp. 06S082]|uniref:hypothetical protein n=1 Tax=Spirulina sp. 06S082 TaxID=3110248 RepID=UPI002B21D14E|nr:hypothetical protein [Spirulina sp. 06S082]MEA5472125.1 hypothetical protein [Spirulina sp. 06S082]